jgi:hypothetical protein
MAREMLYVGRRLVTLLKRALFAYLALLAATHPVNADPAHFWLSASSIAPVGPEAPRINTAIGTIQYLHIWARPATSNVNLPFDAVTNPYRTLYNVSLNLLSATDGDAIVDFVDGTFTVYNPSLESALRRFGAVNDSHVTTTPPERPLQSTRTHAHIVSGMYDRINGIQGFSFPFAGYDGAGFGQDCGNDTLYCVIAQDGRPAWLFASIGYQVVANSGTAELFLQIGYNGMAHTDDTGNSTVPVMFGFDASHPQGFEPTYDANRISDREKEPPISGDGPEAWITAIAGLPGDYNLNGSVGVDDYQFWKASYGTIVVAGTGADGNGDGFVDAADYTVWRNQLAPVLRGDYNDDGTVGPEDYALWKQSYGHTVSPGSGADGNGDGIVDAADYTVWRNYTHSNSAIGSLLTSDLEKLIPMHVPEPNSVAWPFFVLFIVCRIRSSW